MRRRAGPVPVSLVPLLVIALREPERAGRSDLRRDPVRETALLRVPRREGRCLLLRPEGEDRGPVLAAAVGALAVSARRIVGSPEDFQQLGIADLTRVELDEDCLGVTGAMRAHVLVERVARPAAGVADRRSRSGSSVSRPRSPPARPWSEPSGSRSAAGRPRPRVPPWPRPLLPVRWRPTPRSRSPALPTPRFRTCWRSTSAGSSSTAAAAGVLWPTPQRAAA
jgi:hypothetical protein